MGNRHLERSPPSRSLSHRSARQLEATVQTEIRARVARLLGSSPSVIYSFEARGAFSPTFVSGNIERLFGYAPSDYLEDPEFWSERVHPDDLDRVEADVSLTFEAGLNTLEYRFRRKDDTYCWVKDEQQLIRDDQGEPLEVIGSWSDISALKDAERKKSAARARLAQLLASSPAVIYSFKASGDFRPTFVSQNIKEWLGYEPSDYLDSPDFWRNCVHPDDLGRVEGEFGQLFEQGRHTLEYRFLQEGRRAIAGSATNCASSVTRTASRTRWSAHGAISPIARLLKKPRRRRRAACRAAAYLLAGGHLQLQGVRRLSRRPLSARTSGTGLGYEPSDYLDSPDFWRNCVHPDDLGRVEGEFGPAVRAGAPHSRLSLPQEGRQLLLGQRRTAPRR